MSPSPPITLQINLCPGDVAYAERIASHLSACHSAAVCERVLVVDRCRPQSSQYLHAESRFPDAEFQERAQQITAVAQSLVDGGTYDRIVYLDPDSTALRLELSRKYLAGLVSETHDCFGHASLAYYAGIESCRTRYVLHYDADILLYQRPGHQWPLAALEQMAANPAIIAASARICPPVPGPRPSTPTELFSRGGGWLDTWRVEPHAAGWLSDWFSTRCFLLDRERLEQSLPLVGRESSGRFGRRSMRTRRFIHRCLRGPFSRGTLMPRTNGASRFFERPIQSARFRLVPVYPDPPEVLLHQVVGGAGGRCLYLDEPDAWFIHPDTKPAEFSLLFESILTDVNAGIVPERQLGHCGLQLDAWKRPTALESPP